MNSSLALLDEKFPCLAQASYEISCSTEVQKMNSLCYAYVCMPAHENMHYSPNPTLEPGARVGFCQTTLTERTGHDTNAHDTTGQDNGTTRHNCTNYMCRFFELDPIYNIAILFVRACVCAKCHETSKSIP